MSGPFDLERPALYLKRPGVVQLGRTHLLWVPDSVAHGKGIRIAYGSIRRYQVSTASAKKAMMKIDAEDYAKGVKLDFGKETADRDAVRDVLNRKLNTVSAASPAGSNGESGLAGAAGDAAARSAAQGGQKLDSVVAQAISKEEVARRSAIIRNNREVVGLHKRLVGGKLVSDEAFWKAMRFRYDSQGRRKKGWTDDDIGKAVETKGVPSALGGDVGGNITEKESTGLNGGGMKRKIVLTPAKMHEIFVQYPAVERAYKAKVPKSMSEQKFWETFFKSSLFDKDSRGSTIVNKADELFAEFQAKEAALFEKEIQQRAVTLDPEINIDRFDDHRLPHVLVAHADGNFGGPDAKRRTLSTELPSRNLSLIRRFNRHGTLLVDSTAEEGMEDGGEAIALSGKAWRKDEQDRLHPLRDLEKDSTPHFAPLAIQSQKAHFEAQAGKDHDQKQETSSLTPEIRGLASAMLTWSPNLRQWVKPKMVSKLVLDELLDSMKGS